jgi:predicted acylesterase/phospholipase RssA
MRLKLVEQRIRAAPPDLMIQVLLNDVGLVDFDMIDMCLTMGEQAARRCIRELIELRDTPLPSRWALWWRDLRRRLYLFKQSGRVQVRPGGG